MKQSFYTTNPATGETLATYSHLSSNEIENHLEQAFQSYLRFRTKPASEKAAELKSLAGNFRKESQSLSELISLEMGKAIRDSQAEIEKCAKACEFYAENLQKFLSPESVSANYSKSLIVKDSLGPVLAIMPWNFPVWQVIRFAAPAVGIGNPILLKHSDLTAGTANKIAEIFDRSANGLLYNLRIDHHQSAQVVADKRVRGVTLTGSTQAGAKVAETAGRFLKKTVLELGGSDAYVVFADCDIEKAAQVCAQARMVNNGQSCVAAKRFIVEDSILEEFLNAFSSSLRSIRRGHPLDSTTQVGTLAAKKFQQKLLSQCEQLENVGAEKVLDLSAEQKFDFKTKDAFFPARVYTVKNNHEMVFQEEFFGPVSLVFGFKMEKQALDLCNHSVYGLGGAVFSTDVQRAQRFAHLMEAGFVAINDQVKSDPHLPFGGVKNSGYGRELSLYGFNEFCNIKTLGFGHER